MPAEEGKRDLVLAPGQYAYSQDDTRGQIKTHVGPTVVNLSAQERPVKYDPNTQSFTRCLMDQAIQKSPIASEGDYIILENPANDNSKPEEGGSKPSPALKNGSKVNTPGPCTFALWPTQRATVIKGHHLRSNQYLVVRVYNETEARQNWSRGVAAVRKSGENPEQEQTATVVTTPSDDLTIGKLLIIKGTSVSFYIPPTGVEVCVGENNQYVRDALTLENLEYCILVDEDGNKRYERGPQVVFPKPTENFFTEQGVRKFRVIELNPIQGLHLKVIAPYREGQEEKKVGEELFITGKTDAIYYPRVEHSVIKYGDRTKHYATAIPAGEARYLMDRTSGEIKTIRGPQMLLPDPRKEVMVRRVLSDKQCGLWYPGNTEALSYNQSLRSMMQQSPSARSGFVSEGDVAKNVRGHAYRQLASGGSMQSPVFPAASAQIASGSTEALDYANADVAMEAFGGQGPACESAGSAAMADAFRRGTSYTTPRTVTLDTKYEGVPAINVFTGYACLVVSKTGKRRVEKGPCTILLDYDESLEVLELSTGKPKNTDNLYKTVYLRVANNKVSDVVEVTTGDHVNVQLKLSYCVNFEADSPEDQAKWFAVENYVKYLCDHARSMLKGMAQKRKVEDFSNSGVDMVRDFLLGTAAQPTGERPGLAFDENNMRVTDVEILGINIQDTAINQLLNKAQHDVVAANINLHQAEKRLQVTLKEEEITRQSEEAKAATSKRKLELEGDSVKDKLVLELAKIESDKETLTGRQEAEKQKQEVANVTHNADLARKKSASDQELSISKAKSDLEMAKLQTETKAAIERFGAAQSGFSEALITLGNQEMLEKVAHALSINRMIGGGNLTDILNGLFRGTALEGLMAKVQERASAMAIPSNTGDGNSGRRGR
jgi:major vault protein